MSQEQLRETEQAREQARLSAEKSEKIFRATEKPVPRGPTGIPPEAVRHQRLEPAQLPGAPKGRYAIGETLSGKGKRRRGGGSTSFRFRKRVPIFGPLLGRQPHATARLREDTPANISAAEKDKTLRKLDAAIADWSRKYTFRIVHGGTPQEKQEAAVKLRELEGERQAVAAMKPLGLPEHIRRAESWE